MKQNASFSYDLNAQEELIGRFVEGLALIDDLLFRTVMVDNVKAAETIVRVALDMPDIEIQSMRVQHEIRYLGRRGVCFDLIAKRKDGTLLDIEVQKEFSKDNDELRHRSRFYMSALTIASMKKRKKFASMPDAYILFVCSKDPFGYGKPVYRYETCELTDGGGGESLRDGGHVVFFNCAYKGDDAYGRLANDMMSPNADYIDDPVLKDTVKNAKIGEKRNKLMKGASKEMRELAKEYALNKATLNLLKDGTFAPEKIAEVLEIPLEKVLDIKQRAGL